MLQLQQAEPILTMWLTACSQCGNELDQDFVINLGRYGCQFTHPGYQIVQESFFFPADFE